MGPERATLLSETRAVVAADPVIPASLLEGMFCLFRLRFRVE